MEPASNVSVAGEPTVVIRNRSRVPDSVLEPAPTTPDAVGFSPATTEKTHSPVAEFSKIAVMTASHVLAAAFVGVTIIPVLLDEFVVFAYHVDPE